MIELGTKLNKAAFKKANPEKGSKGLGNQKSGDPFGSVLDRAQGKEVNDVIKKIAQEVDLRPQQQEITAMPSQSIEDLTAVGEESRSDSTKKIADIMGEVNDGQVKLQRLMDLVTSGTKFSPQELIAIQAGVFSLVQELELVGKATQEATQGVRQTLNTNLG